MKETVASSTALTVQQGILFTARRAEFSSLVSGEMKESCEAILAASPEGQKRLKLLRNPMFRALVPVFEYLMLPGITLHYALRKKYIETTVLDAMDKGFHQVVNLGAGLDTLLYRLASKKKDSTFVEVDHPATARLKREFAERHGGELDNFHLVPVDFTKDKLEERLEDSGAFRKGVPTCFILEGVTMYLNEDEVNALFESLRRLTDNQAYVVFTFLSKATGRNTRRPLLSFYLKLKGEPLYWTIEKESVPAFLQAAGYEAVAVADAKDMRSRFLPAGRDYVSNESELIAIAQSQA